MDIGLEIETERFRAFTEGVVEEMSGEETEEALRAMALEFIAQVVDKTPVDTGRARAGWIAYAEEEGETIELGGVSQEAVREGKEQSDFEVNFRGDEQFIVVINAVEYITILEFGGSGQAPAGMMRVTMREMAAQNEAEEKLARRFRSAVRQANRVAQLSGGRLRGRTLPG